MSSESKRPEDEAPEAETVAASETSGDTPAESAAAAPAEKTGANAPTGSADAAGEAAEADGADAPDADADAGADADTSDADTSDADADAADADAVTAEAGTSDADADAADARGETPEADTPVAAADADASAADAGTSDGDADATGADGETPTAKAGTAGDGPADETPAENATDEAAPAAVPQRKRDRPRTPGEAVIVRAQAKYVRSSARKARLVCDNIRGKSVAEAKSILAYHPRQVALAWEKVLDSAVANAENNHELDVEDLKILAIYADEGPTIKRFRPRSHGRATPIRKRTAHLSIQLTTKD